MPLSNEAGGFIHDGTLIHDDSAAPTSYTDLDLSSIVGARRALVYLKVKDRTADVRSIAFRTNGDTDEFLNTTSGSCVHAHFSSANYAACLLVETDVNGIVEWESSTASNFDIWVLAYFRDGA